jgi:hypothetical protein
MKMLMLVWVLVSMMLVWVLSVDGARMGGDIDHVRIEIGSNVGGFVKVDDVIDICSDNKKKNQDYIPCKKDKFEFVNEAEDDWINNLLSDGSTRKTIFDVSYSETIEKLVVMLQVMKKLRVIVVMSLLI